MNTRYFAFKDDQFKEHSFFNTQSFPFPFYTFSKVSSCWYVSDNTRIPIVIPAEEVPFEYRLKVLLLT